MKPRTEESCTERWSRMKVTMKAAPKENYWNVHSQEDTPGVASEDPSIHYAQFFMHLTNLLYLE